MRTLSGALMVGIAMLGFGRIAMGDFIPNAITGIKATAGQQGDSYDGNGSCLRVVDGSGLTKAAAGTTYEGQYVHDPMWENNWQAYAINPGYSWFMMDLGKSYSNLDKAWVWNVREVVERGAKNVDVYYAASISSVPSTGSSYDAFTTSGSGWTHLINTDIAEVTATDTPAGTGHVGVTGPVDTKIDLSGITGGARYIAFVINSSYGDTVKTGGGFAEIQVTTIPEPTSMVMLSGGIIALLAYAWRKRR